jgi:hypothetical protein
MEDVTWVYSSCASCCEFEDFGGDIVVSLRVFMECIRVARGDSGSLSEHADSACITELK